MIIFDENDIVLLEKIEDQMKNLGLLCKLISSNDFSQTLWIGLDEYNYLGSITITERFSTVRIQIYDRNLTSFSKFHHLSYEFKEENFDRIIRDIKEAISTCKNKIKDEKIREIELEFSD